jgi:hypothetical protein
MYYSKLCQLHQKYDNVIKYDYYLNDVHRLWFLKTLSYSLSSCFLHQI